tara:strand:+ start:1631 stop:2098 length:468 start_codon:yes stop_codon:yes gene_type:complete
MLTLLLAVNFIFKDTRADISQHFGIEFGSDYNSIIHKSIKIRKNIHTVLIKTDNAPPDTKSLRAEICDNFGLQIITWRSIERSLSSSVESLEKIRDDLTIRFGPSKIKNGSYIWTKNSINIVAKIRAKKNTYQNQIRYFGPNNEECLNQLIDTQD